MIDARRGRNGPSPRRGGGCLPRKEKDRLGLSTLPKDAPVHPRCEGKRNNVPANVARLLAPLHATAAVTCLLLQWYETLLFPMPFSPRLTTTRIKQEVGKLVSRGSRAKGGAFYVLLRLVFASSFSR
ncbi:hypothetical protein MRX96_039323 [Rhipicephalus microplus]